MNDRPCLHRLRASYQLTADAAASLGHQAADTELVWRSASLPARGLASWSDAFRGRNSGIVYQARVMDPLILSYDQRPYLTPRDCHPSAGHHATGMRLRIGFTCEYKRATSLSAQLTRGRTLPRTAPVVPWSLATMERSPSVQIVDPISTGSLDG
jgi:hypothetical protein